MKGNWLLSLLSPNHIQILMSLWSIVTLPSSLDLWIQLLWEKFWPKQESQKSVSDSTQAIWEFSPSNVDKYGTDISQMGLGLASWHLMICMRKDWLKSRKKEIKSIFLLLELTLLHAKLNQVLDLFVNSSNLMESLLWSSLKIRENQLSLPISIFTGFGQMKEKLPSTSSHLEMKLFKEQLGLQIKARIPTFSQLK